MRYFITILLIILTLYTPVMAELQMNLKINSGYAKHRDYQLNRALFNEVGLNETTQNFSSYNHPKSTIYGGYFGLKLIPTAIFFYFVGSAVGTGIGESLAHLITGNEDVYSNTPDILIWIGMISSFILAVAIPISLVAISGRPCSESPYNEIIKHGTYAELAGNTITLSLFYTSLYHDSAILDIATIAAFVGTCIVVPTIMYMKYNDFEDSYENSGSPQFTADFNMTNHSGGEREFSLQVKLLDIRF